MSATETNNYNALIGGRTDRLDLQTDS